MLARAFSHSVIGSREVNQDASLIQDERGLFAVADGVGGGLEGEVASAMAMQGLEELAKAPGDLKEAFGTCQTRILEYALKQHGGPVMGTTCTAVFIEEASAYLCHAGDSHCYVFRDKHLALKTVDHEFYDESMQATVLGSYLGIPTDEHTLEIFEDKFEVQPGDSLLLCTDGLYRQIDEPRMIEILEQLVGEPELIVKTLCEEAEQKAFSDNVTLVYVTIE